MKGVVICGADDGRLRPLTETRAKALLPVCGEPLLGRILRGLTDAGARDIRLCVGGGAGDIAAFCDKIAAKAEIRLSEANKRLGDAGGVRFCLPQSGEPVCAVNADVCTAADLAAVLRYHMRSGAVCTVLAAETEEPDPAYAVSVDERLCLTGAGKGSAFARFERRFETAGVFVLSPQALAMIPPDAPYDLNADLLPALIAQGEDVRCFPLRGGFVRIASPAQYLEAQKLLLRDADRSGEGWRYYGEDHTDGAGNVFSAPCLVGETARFGGGCRIGPNAVIGRGCRIGAQSELRECAVGAEVRIGANSELEGAVADDRVLVGDNCVMEPGSVAAYGVQIGSFARVAAGVRVWPGRRIQPQTVVTRDVGFDTPQSLGLDSFGVSGKAYAQISPADAARIGQAVASAGGMRRIGVGGDGSAVSQVYRDLCSAGVRSCGVICYDFEEMFRAQAFFYAAYCSLDAFIYIENRDSTAVFSFFGRNGGPFCEEAAKKIDSNFRFSAFTLAQPEQTGESFHMRLLGAAYLAALRRELGGRTAPGVGFVCENPAMDRVFRDLREAGNVPEGDGLQFLFNGAGTDFYCMQGERFYSADRIRAAFCRLRFADGKDVLAPEDASVRLEPLAERFGRKVTRLYESAAPRDPGANEMLENLWNFDAVYLSVRLLAYLAKNGGEIERLLGEEKAFSVRRKIIESELPPSRIRGQFEALGAKKRGPGDVYYRIPVSRGEARIRQMGESGRLRLLVEAADLETAKEIAAFVDAKIQKVNIDNRRNK